MFTDGYEKPIKFIIEKSDKTLRLIQVQQYLHIYPFKEYKEALSYFYFLYSKFNFKLSFNQQHVRNFKNTIRSCRRLRNAQLFFSLLYQRTSHTSHLLFPITELYLVSSTCNIPSELDISQSFLPWPHSPILHRSFPSQSYQKSLNPDGMLGVVIELYLHSCFRA